MAKFGSYFALCPIIDQKGLLGIAEDSESGNVLVTLGKKFAIKYRLADQKQLHSWRTKDRFTSPIIYNHEENNYVAVFNQAYLRIWNEEEYLDKLKKLKFNKPIHTLMKCQNESFIIFKNGAVSQLKRALEIRKDFKPTDVIAAQNEEITDVVSLAANGNIFIGLIVKKNGDTSFICTIFNSDNQSEECERIHLKRSNSKLIGYLLMQAASNQVVLITLWSDGKLYSFTIKQQEASDFPGTLSALIDPLLSCKHNIAMTALNEDYIAMYGADCNQEGAALIIYNIQFKVMQCRQSLKLYSETTKLWCLNNNLFLCIGQNLAVIPYHLDNEQLAALVGSHKTIISDPDISIVTNFKLSLWTEKSKKNKPRRISNLIKKDVMVLSEQGWAEATICEELFPKYIENNNYLAISASLDYFNDIPEILIAKSLNFVLNLDGKMFQSKYQKNANLPSNLGPVERTYLLDKLILLKFSDVLLLPYLRSTLQLTNALLLLRYICYLLSEDGHTLHKLDVTKSDAKLIEWGCILLDANYQKFLLSRDDKIVELLTYFNSLVNAHLCCLDELKQVAPMLVELKRGKSFNKTKHIANMKYSIEELNLY